MSARKTVLTVASAACLAMSCSAVKQYEGYWPTVKTDWVGTGHPATGGYGETENVKLGETHDEKYWSDRLQSRLREEYDQEIGECIRVQLPDSARAAMISAAYNAGPGAVCRSPMVAKMNAGDIRGGCNALAGWYVRASGRVVQGLINRRAKERKLCLSGLDQKHASLAPPAVADATLPVHAPVKPAPAPIAHKRPAAKPAKPSCSLSWIFKC